MRRNILLLLSMMAVFLFSPFSDAQSQNQMERILDFNSRIIVNKDASIDVTENISVYANERKILHGIVRRMPTRYQDSYGIIRHTNYQIMKILLNNQITPYHTENFNNTLAIYIGSLEVDLNPGVYDYTIQYHVNHAVNFLKDADELYWNITGNNWDFPIMKASATIQLPEGAAMTHYAGYTGPIGAKGQDFSVRKLASNQIEFASTQIISPGEGLTIAIAWPKGIIHEPTWKDQLKSEIHSHEFIILEITLLVLIYYLIVWYWYGRDLLPPTVIPLFEPPKDISPAAARYIMRMGFDTKTLTAAIVSLATKNVLTIKNDEEVFTLSQQSDNKNAPLKEEKALADAIFEDGPTLKLVQKNSDRVNHIKTVLSQSLKKEYQNTYFVTNSFLLIPALLLTLLTFGITIYFSDDAKSTFGTLVSSFLWILIAGVFLVTKAWSSIQLAFNNRTFKSISSAVFYSILCVPFVIGAIVAAYLSISITSILAIFLLFTLCILNIIFYFLLKAPTNAGRQLINQLEGFKLFLGTTERYRLEQFHPPEQTPEMFEEYLPYAIALNVENAWGEKFNEWLKNAGMEPSTYQPTWYQGAILTGATFASFPTFLDNSLSSAIATSSISVSSSASGGGGSSGGGGGGGGGGGW